MDVINGGVKVNALPELTTALVNHRIAFSQSVDYVQKRTSAIVEPIAKKYGLPFFPFNVPSNASQLGSTYVALETFGPEIPPAPHSPTDGPVWELLAGSIRAVLQEEGKPYIVSPFASTGNTDTTSYWSLVDKNAIYRYVGGEIVDYDGHEHSG